MGRLGHTLSTLRPVGRPTRTQDSLPAAGQALPGGLSGPLGSSEGFELFATSLPLSQASPGASALRSGTPMLFQDVGQRELLFVGRHVGWVSGPAAGGGHVLMLWTISYPRRVNGGTFPLSRFLRPFDTSVDTTNGTSVLSQKFVSSIRAVRGDHRPS